MPRPTLILLFAFVINVSKWGLDAQKLPPARYDGFLYEKHGPCRHHADTILIEAFFDPVCPDSRDSWPPLKQALHYYGSRTSLLLHLLPLPYHDNAYVASRALHIANNLNHSSTFPLLERFFKHQERFYNAQTRNLSRVSVVKDIVEFASVAIGNSYHSAIESGFNDRETDLQTRVSFKYSTSRGVFGTPTFYINGFVLPDAGSTLDYNGWRKFIDPLINAKKGKSEEHVHLSL
ncbi:uncharacterized protein LOC107260941 [Ricinus communis]|uniref:uncharacterized protein LOC107260941 n=1 Tax=Ricinus communis TaxID=3988 RepID=UPI00077298DA|nr:uncharacterized protein LOC107260941 [Ricinus communis]|eukprot:XP_015572482.1 uncharacterized protein LOC107260941 [Ricinus communis]